MLLCVCSKIDHKRRQNVVRTSVTHAAIASCATFFFLPHLTSPVIYYWTDARQHGIYLLIVLTSFSSRNNQAVTHISIAQSCERQDLNAIICKRHQACHCKNRDVGLWGKIELWLSFTFVDIQYSKAKDHSILMAWRDWTPAYCNREGAGSLCCNICRWLAGDWREYKRKQGSLLSREDLTIF